MGRKERRVFASSSRQRISIVCTAMWRLIGREETHQVDGGGTTKEYRQSSHQVNKNGAVLMAMQWKIL